MDEQLIIGGFGGQGVQLMGQLLTKAGLKMGKNVCYIPSYGAEMRGGSTNCNVIISDEPVASPIVGEATCVMVLNPLSLSSFGSSAAPGGALIVNSSLCGDAPARDGVKVINIPANDIAVEIGNVRVVNMIMLGAYLELSKAISIEIIMDCLKETFGERRANLLAINRVALEKGAEYARA